MTIGTIFLKNLDTSKFKSKTNKRKTAKSNRPKATSFPVKLYQMLEECERSGLHSVVSWNPDGLTFKVHKHERFATEILPKHFKQSKYKSFQRQLNFYSFVRVVSGPLEGSYGHSLFVKGNPDSCHNIKRLQSTQELDDQKEKLSYSHNGQVVGGASTQPLALDAHEPFTTTSNQVVHEMNIADMAHLFEHQPTDDLLPGCTPDDIISMLTAGDPSPSALRRQSSLFSLAGQNFFNATNFTEL